MTMFSEWATLSIWKIYWSSHTYLIPIYVIDFTGLCLLLKDVTQTSGALPNECDSGHKLLI